MTADLDPREARSHDEREATLIQALQGSFAAASKNSAYYTQSLSGFDAGQLTSRSALAALPVLPGPIAEPQGADGDVWRFARALRAAGYVAGDIAHNCFSYHLTPAGFMFDCAARALGCAVFPGGIGNTEQQALAMRRYGATAYVGWRWTTLS